MYSVDWARLLSRDPARSSRPSAHASGPVATATLTRPRVSRVVWYLGLTSFFTDVSSEMVSSILPAYLVLYLHLSPLAFGAIDGLYQGFAAFARLGGGFLADKGRSHRSVAAFGYGLSAVCKLGLLAAGNAWGLLAATIAIDRTGKGIRTAPRDALISLNSDRDGLASAFGVHRALDAAGAVLGPLVAFLVFSSLPGAYDVIFIVSFCVAMVGLGVILFLVDTSAPTNAQTQAATSEAPAVSVGGAVGLLRLRAFRRLCLAGSTLSLATVSDSFLFLALQRQIGFGASYFPLLYVGVAACNSLLALPVGRLADRYGRWRTFLCGHAVLWLAYLLLVVPGIDGLRLVCALLLLGVYYAASDGVLTAMASAALPSRLCGSGLAFLVTLTNGGRLLASLLFGAVWQWGGLTNAFLLFGAALAIGIATAGLTMRPGPEPLTPLDVAP